MMTLNKDKILISDSCVLFDLTDLEIIMEFFDLGYEVYTTPMVINEITDDAQSIIVSKYVTNGSLIIDTEDSYDSVQKLCDEHAGLSYTDCSVLELAIRKSGVIISTDKSLRNESVRRNITVKGILWIIETLIKEKIITIDFALKKLEKYPEINKRAPLKELDFLIKKIKNIINKK
jgi:rRNA maturation endonuclease Nob1